MRKALVIGINDYPQSPLKCCVNDAVAFAEAIKRNGDDSPNFTVHPKISVQTKGELLELIKELFRDKTNTSLLYFAGHGSVTDEDTYLVTPDFSKYDPGVSMTELLQIVNNSPAQNRIVVLDCCHAGDFGVQRLIGDVDTRLSTGTTILSAAQGYQQAVEDNGHGVFTNLLLAGLAGGAADIGGNITTGGIYAYVDAALNEWQQRPVFKTNVIKFNPLKKVPPKIPTSIIRKIIEYFPTPGNQFPLNPSFEFKNSLDEKNEPIEPYADPNNVKIFKDLQKLQSVGLLVPVDAEHMYFAAMQSTACKLTALGHYYWRLVHNERI